MSTEWILQELYALWDKLKILFERFLDAPAIIRAWSEGRASTGDRAALVVSVVLIVAVVAWVVNFFKAGFWKKLGMLFSAALLILAAAIVLSFFSKAEESPCARTAATASPAARPTPSTPARPRCGGCATTRSAGSSATVCCCS